MPSMIFVYGFLAGAFYVSLIFFVYVACMNRSRLAHEALLQRVAGIEALQAQYRAVMTGETSYSSAEQ